ncbi:hypothetical protein LCGC14_1636860 [marine sediment metagenome]|uniref:NTP pyrophosphohydrolase MazG-like domain-containing protein n=1 Tax=marine sediment metagenome TaxID=412755 RepID=A0A0F9I1A0_9ZZZZ
MGFRKKPIVVEATQWHKNGDHPAAGQYSDETTRDTRQTCEHCKQTLDIHGWIDTLEGGHIVCPGDWIITGVQGERYPCKPDIFDATYEPESEAVGSRWPCQDLHGGRMPFLNVDSDGMCTHPECHPSNDDRKNEAEVSVAPPPLPDGSITYHPVRLGHPRYTHAQVQALVDAIEKLFSSGMDSRITPKGQGVCGYISVRSWRAVQDALARFKQQDTAQAEEIDDEQVQPGAQRGVSAIFIEAMDEKLELGRRKGREEWDLGRYKGHCHLLVSRLKEETGELLDALDGKDKALILREAADVANFAMFIADHKGALQLDDTAQAAEEGE